MNTPNDEQRHANQLAWRRRYRIKNHAKIQAYAARYRERNRLILRAKQAGYLKDHPAKNAEFGQKRRARKAGVLRNDLTAAQWQAIKKHYDSRCVYCGRKMQRLTQDHLTPLSKGGSHTMANVVPACMQCNARKRDGEVLKPVQPLLLL